MYTQLYFCVYELKIGIIKVNDTDCKIIAL